MTSQERLQCRVDEHREQRSSQHPWALLELLRVATKLMTDRGQDPGLESMMTTIEWILMSRREIATIEHISHDGRGDLLGSRLARDRRARVAMTTRQPRVPRRVVERNEPNQLVGMWERH